MTISAYSSAIVDGMLGWLKGIANWVLRLFNLAGGDASPLMWLSQNWLKLLILLLVIGVAGDVLVWLVRWRPHWVWFRRERVIVEDEHFFNDYAVRENLESDGGAFLEKNWHERDYVVASTLVNRRDGALKARGGRGDASDARRTSRRRKDAGASFQRGERRRPAVSSAPDPLTTRRQTPEPESPRPFSDLDSDFFGTDGSRPGVTDLYEDEVFNVNSLPKAGEYGYEAPEGDSRNDVSEA